MVEKEIEESYFIMDKIMVENAEEILIPIKPGTSIKGNLKINPDSKHVILFAHGSGSGRFSPRNNYVADLLDKENFSTLLIDLLTEDEQKKDQVTMEFRFDIPHLTRRIISTVKWLHNDERTQHLKTGFYGASTGASAAFWAAAEIKDAVFSIVSRGGRVDLAKHVAHDIRAPVLLIVGSRDPDILRLNEEFLDMLEVKKYLHVVSGATHLFEEEGALEEVAQKTVQWFKDTA